MAGTEIIGLQGEYWESVNLTRHLVKSFVKPYRALTRMANFMPTVLPMVAAANIWLFFYTPGYGLLNQIGGS